MRFGVQILSLQPGTVGGQEVFLRRLLPELLPLLGDDRLVLFGRPALAADGAFSGLLADERVESVVEDPTPHYGSGYADWNRRLLDRARLDAVYFPLFFFYPRPLALPVVLHIPDIQHEYMPENFTADELAWRRERIPESVRLAEAVITPSQFTAVGLCDRLGADPEKVHVLPFGGFSPDVLEGGVTAALPREVSDHPFVLYPAADWPHKNHETLLRAMALLAKRGRPEHVVLTGLLARRRESLLGLVRQLGLSERVHWLGPVSESVLIRLYRAARVMAFPSQFEGFGLPLVEAMQLGCPVVASRAAGVAETAGEAAAYCDGPAEVWADALQAVLSDDVLSRALRDRGLQRAAQFSWRECAARHIELLRQIAP